MSIQKIRDGQLRTDVQRSLRTVRRRAVLGDENGVIYQPGRPGYVRVREITASGLSIYKVVRQRSTMKMTPGRSVFLGLDEDGELAVLNTDFAGIEQQGGNPFLDNPADDAVTQFINQSAIVTLLSHPISTSSTPSTDVAVRAWIYVEADVWHYFPGERVALSGYIPAAGLHRLACLYLTSADTIEVVGSTAKDTTDPLDIDDIQECWGGATSGSKPVWAWRLVGGMTAVNEQHSFLDMRQFINVNAAVT